MTVPRRQQIERAFSGAADYDGHARVQRAIARDLADRIAALPLPAAPRILEIGCGTGFLTEALIERGIGGTWLVTDISPDMLARCRQRIGEDGNRSFAVLDGEYGKPGEAAGFDLICSSLALQWFDDQPAALARMVTWLAPGGHCMVATLGSGTFAEWRAAHEAEGLVPGTPRFLALADFAATMPGAQAQPPCATPYVEHHDSGLGFIRALRAIGAHTATHSHQPLSAKMLRRVMRRFEQGGSAVTYDVVTCHFTADASPQADCHGVLPRSVPSYPK